jgi:hypothetical protein
MNHDLWYNNVLPTLNQRGATMKNTITAAALIIFIISILWACGGGGSPAQLPPAPPMPSPDKPAPITEKTIFIYDPVAEIIGTSDGEFYYDLAPGKSANARDGFIAIGDVLHDIDINGISQTTQRLPVYPDAVTISGYIWSFEIIGGYTKIYRGSSEYGNYLDNSWRVSDAIATAGGDIIAIDDQYNYHSVAEPNLNIRFASHEGIMVHSMDVANHRAYIRGIDYDTRVLFNTNYFFQADQWILADNIWYSWNGYTWDGVTLTELSTSMSDFTTQWYAENPVLIAVGSRIEHSESVTYWIECNTGMLYRYTPSIDRLETVINIYQGSGFRSDGISVKRGIKPVLASDYLFFTWNDMIWKYNFDTEIISSFASGVEIWAM